MNTLSNNKFFKSNYDPFIDGLRSISVIFVIFFHAYPKIFPNGFIGVDVFFVISGFLITNLLIKQKMSINVLLNFYARRICRIFPALIIVLLTSIVIAINYLYKDEFINLSKYIFSGSLFFSNFISMGEFSYFSIDSSLKPLNHLWSLAIEEQFYILFPFIFFLKNKYIFRGVLFLFVISFLSNIYHAYLNTNLLTLYYSPWTRAWELLAGSLLSLYISEKNFKSKKILPYYFSYIGFLLLIFALISSTYDYRYPGAIALIIVSATLFLIIPTEKSFIKTLISNNIFVFVGKISYPLYLWHFLFLGFSRVIYGNDLSHLIIFISLLTTFIFSIATFYLAESFFRNNRRTNLKSIVLLILILFISVLGYLGKKDKYLENRDIKLIEDKLLSYNQEIINDDDCMKKFAPEDAKNYLWYFCRATKDKNQIILIGDSYANALFSGLEQIDFYRNYGILHSGACEPFASIMLSQDEVFLRIGKNHPCLTKNNKYQTNYISNYINNSDVKLVLYVMSSHQKNMNMHLEVLKKIQKNILVILPLQIIKKNPKLCVRKTPFLTSNKICINEYEDANLKLREREIKNYFESNNMNAKLFNPNKIYCNDSSCDFTFDGLPIFRDSSGHLNIYGAKLVGENLKNFIIENGILDNVE